MGAILRSMTLQTLLKRHGVTRLKDFAQRAELSRQHAWNLWHAQVGLGTTMVKRLHARLGIPLEELLQIDHVPTRGRKASSAQARPRQRRTGEATP